MKHLYLLLMLSCSFACGQQASMDLSSLKNDNDFQTLVQQLQASKQLSTTQLGSAYDGDSLLFFSCKMAGIYFINDGLRFFYDSTQVKRNVLYRNICAKYGPPNRDGDGRNAANIWDNDSVKITLYSEIGSAHVDFKKDYNYAFPNLYKEIAVPEHKYIYTVRSAEGGEYIKVAVNGIVIPSQKDSKYNEFYLLNPWVTQLPFRITALDDYSEHYVIVRSIAGKDSSDEVIDSAQITALPYKVSGWSRGADLRKDAHLKQKIIAVYTQLATALETGDLETVSKLLYLRQKEWMTCNYQNKKEDCVTPWLKLVHTSQTMFRYKIASNFNLEFSDDGKLVFAVPPDGLSMLHVIGKEFTDNFNFYFFQDADSSQLQIIR